MQKVLVANYKMNGDIKFYQTVQEVMNEQKITDTKIILCPPFVYMPFLQLDNENISLGAQDISCEINKQSTGQISPNMLKEFNVEYTLVGHSERRSLNETDMMVANKTALAQENGITPIVCVGEMDVSTNLNMLENQVEQALSKIKNDNIMFAYEPIWAIGSGVQPTVSRINKALDIIKNTAKNKGLNVKVLYGGSVNASNYKEIEKSNADGFLMGGVSLKLNDFLKIVKGE